MAGVDRVWKGCVGELGEIHGVGVAVNEKDMFWIDSANSFLDSIVEIDKIEMIGIGGLVEGVIACNEWIPSVASGNFNPEIDCTVLEFFEFPEERPIKTGIGMPVLILATRHSVKVEYNIQIVIGTVSHDAVKEGKPRLLEGSRVQVVFEMAVIEGNPDTVEAEGGEEFGVGVREEIVQESIEEILILLGAEDGEHGLSMLELCSRVARDEILHVEVAAESGAFKNDLISISVDDFGTADMEDRMNRGSRVPIHFFGIQPSVREREQRRSF